MRLAEQLGAKKCIVCNITFATRSKEVIRSHKFLFLLYFFDDFVKFVLIFAITGLQVFQAALFCLIFITIRY